MGIVLVTGGSGFVGSYVILKLLREGHRVRTTIRNAGREADVRAMIRDGGHEPAEQLAFFRADLMEDGGWADAVNGCDYVLHVASPFPQGAPKDENELIAPARDGTLRVLRASRDAGVKRVVITSSFAAIGYGHASYDGIFNEENWTDLRGADVQPYMKSKVLAERAAWEFLDREGGLLELSVINPVGIFGPVLGTDFSSSVALIQGLLKGMPGVPRLYFGMVDVRDLADLHLRAMQSDAAKGQRFLAVGGDVISLFDVARMLRQHLGAAASKVPNQEFPDDLVRAMAASNPQAKGALPQLGIIRRSTSDKARRLLGWHARPYEDTIIDTARSLIRHGVVREE
jgi:dihydroflavonol-4-reductase